MKMNPEIKQRWIEALESGKYPKTRRTLKDDYGFCCLGVLCDLHAQETGNQFEKLDSGNYRYLTSISFLPDDVAQWAGLPMNHDSMVFAYKSSGRMDSLTSLNDNSPTFTHIINAIKNYF